MTGILITLEQNLNWMKSFQNLKRKSVQMQTEKLSKTEMVAKDVLIPIKSLVGNTMVTIKDGQFKKKSTQVSVDNPEALVDNDYIQAMDEVPVTFDNFTSYYD